MEIRLPFYMAYPMPLAYDDERRERQDFEYLKSLYPNTAKKILPYVEEECERMEYAGSMIYDEYPDGLQIHLMCGRIYDKVKKMEDSNEGAQTQEWLREFIALMLFHELFRRRCCYRRNRSKFYMSDGVGNEYR